jgi:hypothetical protein
VGVYAVCYLQLKHLSAHNMTGSSFDYYPTNPVLTLSRCRSCEAVYYEDPIDKLPLFFQIPVPLHANGQLIQKRLQQWDSAFQSLKEATWIIQTVKSAQLTKLLEVHHKSATIMVAGLLEPEETIYDEYDDVFRRIVDLSHQLLQEEFSKPSINTFSVEMGVIQPLYFAATKCRISEIRRSAIQLLGTVRRLEGVWNGQIMALIAARVQEIEESGLEDNYLRNHRVPESHRVRGMDTIIDPKSRVASFSCRLRPDGIFEKWEARKICITW